MESRSGTEIHQRTAEHHLRVKNRLSEIFLTVPDDEMYHEVLLVVLEAMESEFGVFGYIDEEGAFVVPSMSRHIWEECNVPDKDIVFPRDEWGVSSWPRAIREKKTNYTNEPSTITPDGHVPIQRHISLPIIHRGEVIGLFQVANKAEDYTEADVDFLEIIGNIVGPILDARLHRDRLELKRAQIEEQLRASNQQLEAGNQQLKATDQQLRASNEQLEATNQQLKQYRDNLELLVEERTIELESINSELEAFAYSVSHDLRAPLRAIEGFSQALMEDYLDKLDDEGHRYLNLVSSEAQRMAQLIDDLLNLSRVTRAEMNAEPVDLSHLANDIITRFRNMEPTRKVETVVAGGLKVVGDVHLLRQVLENLLENAWKFTSQNRTALIEFDVIEKEGIPVFFVRDNGVGFDMKYAEKLFTPFQRLHSMKDYSGTGIGLSTVKRIIMRHGGNVWIESEIEKGTTCYVTIPEHKGDREENG